MGGLAVSDVWLLTRTDGLSCYYGGIVNAGSRALRGVDSHAANRATGFVHQRSTEGVDLGGQLSASVAGVNDAARLQKKRRGFDIGARTVLGTTRHDEKLRWAERNVAFAHLDFQLAVQDQERTRRCQGACAR